MKSIKSLAFSLLFLSFATCAQSQSDKVAEERYTFKKGDSQGINKWYKGRQIAYVMGYQGMAWLERRSREREEGTSVLLENMALKPNEVIADIGAGSGYHVFQMAPRVAPGKVYAVDIQPQMLDAIRKRMEKEEVQNVVPVQGSSQSVNLRPNSIDKVLLVDVYHEFDYPYEMMQSIKIALKPNGKVYLIEYRKEDRKVPIKEIHKMTEAQAVLEMEAAGFVLEENISNLPWQHCMVFVKGSVE